MPQQEHLINAHHESHNKKEREGRIRDGLKYEKWFPLQGRRASSFLVLFVCTFRGWSFQKHNRKARERQDNNNRPIKLPKVITFSIDYKYTT